MSPAPDASAVSIDPDLCNGCGNCVQACPVNVLQMDGPKAVVALPNDCCVCFLCTDDCPTGAIHVSHLAPNKRHFSAYETLDPARLALGNAL